MSEPSPPAAVARPPGPPPPAGSADLLVPSGRTVGGLLRAVVVGSVVATLAVGLVGVLAVEQAGGTVNEISREIGPAQVSNAELMETLLTAETELRGFLLLADPAYLRRHGSALARVPSAESGLRDYLRAHGEDTEVAGLVGRQQEAVRRWVREFVRPAVGAVTPVREQAALARGTDLFDEVEVLNGEGAEVLDERVAGARRGAEEQRRGVVTLVALVAVAGALLCAVPAWRAGRGIRRPLADLEGVVADLRDGRLEVRAEPTGPVEIQRLGSAVNEMAEEISRARVVELDVQQRLLDVDRVKSEFVANVSHELRTPLTSIAGYLELLADDLTDELDTEQREMMAVMHRNVRRLRGLIEDLLDLGRAERAPAALQHVDLLALLRDVAEDLRLSAGTRQVSIHVDVDPDVEPGDSVVEADAAQLQRALTNLLSNAVKFSHEGGDVGLHLARQGEDVEVRVTDRGIGIPGEDQDKLGERFFRASNAVSAHIPGTGLGLRMVQAIVTHHQGSFGLVSREGEGTTATVRLPVQRGEHRRAHRRERRGEDRREHRGRSEG